MKGIVFRGKRKEWKKYPQDEWWVNGYVWIGADSAFIIPENAGLSHDEKTSFASVPVVEVEPKTVGQYSFLNDKKGKRIFEGDIVSNKGKWEENIGVIVFKTGKFVVDWRIHNSYSEKGISLRTDDVSSSDEVIGNIFDNPDLITSKKGAGA